MARILMLGATGYLGRYVTQELHMRGHQIRAVVRDRHRADSPGPWGAPALTGLIDEWVEGSIQDATVMTGLSAGMDHVVSCLGVTKQKTDPWTIDHDANLAALRDAESHGVKGFCYVNVINGDTCPTRLTQAKAAFVNALVRSDITSQIIDPPAYFSDMMEVFSMVQRSGRIWLFKASRGVQINPIHGADLAVVIADRVEASEAGRWQVGGPDLFTWAQLGRLAGRIIGKPVRVGIIPTPLVKAMIWLTSRIAPHQADTLRFITWNMTHDTVGEPAGTHHLADFWAAQSSPR